MGVGVEGLDGLDEEGEGGLGAHSGGEVVKVRVMYVGSSCFGERGSEPCSLLFESCCESE